MIRVYVARQRYDAYLVADRLNQAGIRAHVFNEHASSIAGEVPPDVAQPQVWIADDDDEPRARTFLRQLEVDATQRRPSSAANAASSRPATSGFAGTAACVGLIQQVRHPMMHGMAWSMS
jgi:hypothetical protein